MKNSDIPNIIEGIQSLEKLSGGNLSQWRYTLENANSIWKRCPYKVGDLVSLVKTPEITEKKSWGWLGAKHFLKEGAIGRINEISFHDGLFFFYVTFENETWIDYEGVERPVSRLANYSFSEHWLAPANYDQLSCEAL